MNEQEKSDLKLKVLRALDAAGIGRKEAMEALFTTMPFDDSRHLEITRGKVEVQDGVYNDKEYDVFAKTIATFTFDELFPELEWEKNVSTLDAEAYGFNFSLPLGESGYLTVEQDWSQVGLPFRTPELAKETAQMVADQLAKAGRVDQ